MGAIAGVWNHTTATANPLLSAKAQDTSSGAGSTGSSSTDSATISANDFLTLLVTELQNQDPTAQTDPNEYVNQLVSVNSLEQLININQTLNTSLGTTSGTTGSSTGASPQAQSTSSAQTAQPHAGATAEQAAAIKSSPGNLGIPPANPSAHAVAQALSGHLR